MIKIVEYNVIYDQIKNLRTSEGVRQKSITLTNNARKRGEGLVRKFKKLMISERNDWDFSFLVEFLINLADQNINTFIDKVDEVRNK